MPFKRADSEIPTRVKAYKFRIYPPYQKPDFDEEIKSAFFAQARAMNAFWNRLVEIRQQTLSELDQVFNTQKNQFDDAGEGEKLNFSRLKKLSPDFAAATGEIWKKFETATRELAASDEIKSSLGWEAREDVFTRFDAAHKKALKSGAVLKFKSEGFVEQFQLPHRFSAGGKAFAVFHKGKSKKVYIEKLPADIYEVNNTRNKRARLANGKFGVGREDETIVAFRVILDRRIPAEAKIKTAVLTGRYRVGKWSYYIVLTVDEPAPPLVKKSGSKPVAGLDLGWRKFDEYLRIGMLVDSFGNAYELRTPINPPKNKNLRRFERFQEKRNLAIPQYPQNWHDLEDWQAKISGAKDLIKEQLSALELPAAAEIKSLKSKWERVGKRGLFKLRRILGDISPATEAVEKALELINDWADKTHRLESEIEFTRQRLLSQRKYHYSLIANWLKSQYAEIAMEGDLSLQQIAEAGAKAKLSEENGAVIKNAAKYRVIASLYELKSAMQQRQLKGEEWLIKKKSAYTTKTCYVCGSECESTAKLEITCLKGHSVDQDVQAALNLRNKLADDFPSKKPAFEIPEDLRKIIVPVEIKL